MQEHHDEMQPCNDEITRLLFKLIKGEQLFPDEQQQLDNWIAASPHNKQVFEEVTNEELLEQEVNGLVGYDQKFLWRQIHRGINGKPLESRLLYFFKTLTGRVAAVIVFLGLGMGIYIAFKHSPAKLTNAKTNSSVNTDPAAAKEDIVRDLADAAAIALNNATNDKMMNEGDSFYNTPSTDLLSPLSYTRKGATDEEQNNNGFLLTGALVGLEPIGPISNGVNGIQKGLEFAGESFGAAPMDATKSLVANASEEEQPAIAMETGVPDIELNPNFYMDEAGKRWIGTQNSPVRKRSNKTIILSRPVKANSGQKIIDDIDTANIMSVKDEALFPLD
jgi:hypothetical protein